ncbi:glycerophosphodiester phosphodiesterase family protein [Schleiferia thermophila]|uniref:glycerophosphodiester phosphodiesterase family protein n=1 Tax=Schleiferia thermophila TaxID=884107 RepID=UPI003EEADA39
MTSDDLRIGLLLLVTGIFTSCKHSNIEIHGHRGCRGYWPENSIYGMIAALQMDVDALEMDVVVTSDLQVILSHEPFFQHEICLDPNGNRIYESTQEAYNIYEFTYEQVKKTKCGTYPHPRFPLQKQREYFKPKLSDVIDTVEVFAKNKGKKFYYNIEIKARDEWEGIFHPDYRAFADLVAGVIYRHKIVDRCLVQSFHLPTLQYLRQAHPALRLALLIDADEKPSEKLDMLGFLPDVMSPHYSHILPQWVKFCNSRRIKLIPWTVNDIPTALKLIKMGVHGIITDYPDSIARATGR